MADSPAAACDPYGVTNLYGRYVFAVDRQDGDLLGACFHSDAIYEVIDNYRIEGRDAILDKIARRWQPGNRHQTHDLMIEPSGDGHSAQGRARFVVTRRDGTPVAAGEYADSLSWQAGDGWRFDRRTIFYQWRREAPP